MEEKEKQLSNTEPLQGQQDGTEAQPGVSDPASNAPTSREEYEKQAEQYKDLFLRKAAEFENYKRRMENETSTIIQYANEDLITSILPVIADFERSLKLSKETGDFDSLYKGVELMYQKFLKTLEAQGIKALETVGKEFDVHYHDALMQIPKEDVPPHTVIQEVEKGYTLYDKVIKHAKVIVSTLPSEAAPSSERLGKANMEKAE